MKNIEKYEHEISKLVNKGNSLSCAIAIAAGISNGNCFGCKCSDCHKKCLEWMHEDYKEQILSDDEKEIVRVMLDFIHKFGCTVIYVRKIDIGNCKSFISIKYENHVVGTDGALSSPIIYNDKFKGMELNRKYSIEELGITCPTQKDS